MAFSKLLERSLGSLEGTAVCFDNNASKDVLTCVVLHWAMTSGSTLNSLKSQGMLSLIESCNKALLNVFFFVLICTLLIIFYLWSFPEKALLAEELGRRHADGTFTSDINKVLDDMAAKEFLKWLINTKVTQRCLNFILFLMYWCLKCICHTWGKYY